MDSAWVPHTRGWHRTGAWDGRTLWESSATLLTQPSPGALGGRQNPREEFGGQIVEILSHHKSTPGKLFEHTQISVQRSSETCLSD